MPKRNHPRIAASKVWRAEDLYWEPPILTFNIERHGGTTMGSTRAEIQTWSVNLETLSAEYSITGRRQVEPIDKRLDTKKLAQEVTSQILRHDNVEHLRWLSDKRVRVLVGKLTPLTYQQTTLQRRRRFARELSSLLQQKRWRLVSGTSPHTYEEEPAAPDRGSF